MKRQSEPPAELVTMRKGPTALKTNWKKLQDRKTMIFLKNQGKNTISFKKTGKPTDFPGNLGY